MNLKSYEYVNRQHYQLSSEGVLRQHLCEDIVISEEPLNIVLHWTCQKTKALLEKNLMVTMRSPGQDALLVTGLLLSYAIIKTCEQIGKMCTEEHNQCDVYLTDSVDVDWKALKRQFVSHSGCGICGANDVKKLANTFNHKMDDAEGWLSIKQLLTFPSQLRDQQSLFSVTGGVHSAGVFTVDACLAVYEDVGRHNAVDKVIGNLLGDCKLGVHQLKKQNILMLSGRVSFELMQKAVAANIPVVVAIGAPSSLAISVAKQFNITLIGFVTERRCNVYHGDFRLIK